MHAISSLTVVQKLKQIYRLDVLCPVNRQGSYQGETKCIAATGQILIHYLPRIPLLGLEGSLGETKLTESGRQKLSSQKPCQQVQHAKLMRASKEKAFDSPGIPPKGSLISASAVPHLGVKISEKYPIRRKLCSCVKGNDFPSPHYI